MARKRFLSRVALVAILIIVVLPVTLEPTSVVAQNPRADAVVLVNSDSADYDDFEHFIQPYLDTFGVPYTVADISTTDITADIVDYALLVVGHRQLYTNDVYLSATEEGYISAAVDAGMGLVNFDNDLSVSGQPRYQFVQDTFGFDYVTPPTGSGVTFVSPDGEPGLRVNCWEDDQQDPVLPTTTNGGDVSATDGEWTEFWYLNGSRPHPTVFAAVDEQEQYGLGVMRFYTSTIPNGEYQVIANLYTSSESGRVMRYYYGYTPGDPEEFYVDVSGGVGGADEHEEYDLGTVDITDGNFEIYVQDADLQSGAYPYFGWGWIRLVPTGAPPPEMHYITDRHEVGESIGTGSMTLAGIATPLPEDVTVLATTGTQPFLAVTTSGQGRAVQWGSYDWISHSVLGQLYGLDDVVWRSIVWAARKPFVTQSLPPFVTMRVDDDSGQLWWVEIANEFDLKPWVGAFIRDFTEEESAHLSSLVNAGLATTSIHALTWNDSFYFQRNTGPWPDDVIAAHYAEGTQWHEDHNIPISSYLVAHFSEIGVNALDGLVDWGVEFLGTMIEPGAIWGAPWIVGGPYRLYEPRQSSSSGIPFYYADFVTVADHPEYDGQFFNCVSDPGYHGL